MLPTTEAYVVNLIYTNSYSFLRHEPYAYCTSLVPFLIWTLWHPKISLDLSRWISMAKTFGEFQCQDISCFTNIFHVKFREKAFGFQENFCSHPSFLIDLATILYQIHLGPSQALAMWHESLHYSFESSLHYSFESQVAASPNKDLCIPSM